MKTKLMDTLKILVPTIAVTIVTTLVAQSKEDKERKELAAEIVKELKESGALNDIK